jgi:hypothetical protein
MSHHQLLKNYYLVQARTGRGPGYVVYKGSRMQRGSGFGSILSGLLKSPLLKKGLKYAAKTGLSTVGDILSGVTEGQSFKQAARSGISRQAEVQKKKALKKLKTLVGPNMRRGMAPPQYHTKKKSIKRRKGGRNRTDNFGTVQ